MGLLGDGMAMLNSAASMSAMEAATVVYAVGESSVSITAVPLMAGREMVDADGLVTKLDDQDFAILAADLVIGGSAVTPAPGHRITWAGRVYEVLPIEGRQCFNFSDKATRTRYRIHTKQISAS